MRITLDTGSTTDYDRFLKIKALPQYRFEGTTAIVPDEYAAATKNLTRAMESRKQAQADLFAVT